MAENQKLVVTLVKIADDLLSNLDTETSVSRIMRKFLNNAGELEKGDIFNLFFCFLCNFQNESIGVEGSFDTEEAISKIKAVEAEFQYNELYENIIQLMTDIASEFSGGRSEDIFLRIQESDSESDLSYDPEASDGFVSDSDVDPTLLAGSTINRFGSY